MGQRVEGDSVCLGARDKARSGSECSRAAQDV